MAFQCVFASVALGSEIDDPREGSAEPTDQTEASSHRAYIEENRVHRDELAVNHPETDHYDEAFLAGESTLRRLEREELDVAGDRLLHLQCHFGLDTLSWVRDDGAAHATGVDFAPTAIETAGEPPVFRWRTDHGRSRRQLHGLENQRSHGSGHSLGEVVTALTEAGLAIEFLHEHPWSFFERYDAMEADEDGRWWLPGHDGALPFTFSLKARKPA